LAAFAANSAKKKGWFFDYSWNNQKTNPFLIESAA